MFVFLIGCLVLSRFNHEKNIENFISWPENLRNLYILDYKSEESRNYSQLITENYLNGRDDSKRKLLDLEELTKLAIYPLGKEIIYESNHEKNQMIVTYEESESNNTKFMK